MKYFELVETNLCIFTETDILQKYTIGKLTQFVYGPWATENFLFM